MQLPQHLKLIKVTYEYADGTRYQITSEDVENYEKNKAAADYSHLHHGGAFKPVDWKYVGGGRHSPC